MFPLMTVLFWRITKTMMNYRVNGYIGKLYNFFIARNLRLSPSKTFLRKTFHYLDEEGNCKFCCRSRRSPNSYSKAKMLGGHTASLLPQLMPLQ